LPGENDNHHLSRKDEKRLKMATKTKKWIENGTKNEIKTENWNTNEKTAPKSKTASRTG
jgi:hypothetical protein